MQDNASVSAARPNGTPLASSRERNDCIAHGSLLGASTPLPDLTMLPRLHRARVTAVLALQAGLALGTLAGCGDERPLAAPEGARITGVAAPSPSRVAPALFDDAIGRLLPSFADQTRALELRSRLEEFTAAYEARDDRAARSALASARRLYIKGGAHAANLSALGLALGQAEALLDSTTAAEAESHD